MPSPYGPPRGSRLTAAPSDGSIVNAVGNLRAGESRTFRVFASDAEDAVRAGAVSIRRDDFADHVLYEIRGYVQDDVEGQDRRLPDLAVDAYHFVSACAFLRVIRDQIAAIGPITEPEASAAGR